MRPSLTSLENPKTLIHESVSAEDVTKDVIAPIFRRPSNSWWIGLADLWRDFQLNADYRRGAIDRRYWYSWD